MERLTETGIVYNFPKLDVAEIRWLERVQKRLAAYEQAEQDGRLLVLPCKVGDTVWTNISVQGDRYRLTDRPYPVKGVFLGMGEKSAYFHVEYDNGRVFPFDFDQFGKTVFLTREEAEAVLKTQSGIELSEKTQSEGGTYE